MISSKIFWLLYICSTERIKILYNFSKVCWSAPQSLWVQRSFSALLYLSFRICKWEMKDSFFLSKITLRNLYWTTTGISNPSNFIVGLWCSFLYWQKCMHCVFVLEILKPFMIAYLFILLMPCCSWHSVVRICLDLEVMQKSSTNK